MDGRTSEQRAELDKMLGGDMTQVDADLDQRIAESYREDGLNDLQIRMQEELRHATTTMEKAEIKVKYSKLASDRKAQQQASSDLS